MLDHLSNLTLQASMTLNLQRPFTLPRTSAVNSWQTMVTLLALPTTLSPVISAIFLLMKLCDAPESKRQSTEILSKVLVITVGYRQAGALVRKVLLLVSGKDSWS